MLYYITSKIWRGEKINEKRGNDTFERLSKSPTFQRRKSPEILRKNSPAFF